MILSTESEVRQRIHDTLKIQGRKKTTLSIFLGYEESSKSSPVNNILSGKKILTINLLNQISQFLFLPVGYFLFGEKNSPITQVEEKVIFKKINFLFSIQPKEKKSGLTKYQLGEKLGGGKTDTAKIQTVNRILQGKRKISITDLEIIAAFFNKPINWFFLE